MLAAASCGAGAGAAHCQHASGHGMGASSRCCVAGYVGRMHGHPCAVACNGAVHGASWGLWVLCRHLAWLMQTPMESGAVRWVSQGSIRTRYMKLYLHALLHTQPPDLLHEQEDAVAPFEDGLVDLGELQPSKVLHARQLWLVSGDHEQACVRVHVVRAAYVEPHMSGRLP